MSGGNPIIGNFVQKRYFLSQIFCWSVISTEIVVFYMILVLQRIAELPFDVTYENILLNVLL